MKGAAREKVIKSLKDRSLDSNANTSGANGVANSILNHLWKPIEQSISKVMNLAGPSGGSVSILQISPPAATQLGRASHSASDNVTLDDASGFRGFVEDISTDDYTSSQSSRVSSPGVSLLHNSDQSSDVATPQHENYLPGTFRSHQSHQNAANPSNEQLSGNNVSTQFLNNADPELLPGNSDPTSSSTHRQSGSAPERINSPQVIQMGE